jgi:uncharacterized protein (TIGR02118 family)
MIRLSVMYPRTDGTHFDSDYWVSTHMPMLTAGWPQMVKWEADLGLDGQPNYAVAQIYFNSPDDMQAAMGEPATAGIMGDIANYTDTAPVMQVSTVAASS